MVSMRWISHPNTGCLTNPFPSRHEGYRSFYPFKETRKHQWVKVTLFQEKILTHVKFTEVLILNFSSSAIISNKWTKHTRDEQCQKWYNLVKKGYFPQKEERKMIIYKYSETNCRKEKEKYKALDIRLQDWIMSRVTADREKGTNCMVSLKQYSSVRMLICY